MTAKDIKNKLVDIRTEYNNQNKHLQTIPVSSEEYTHQFHKLQEIKQRLIVAEKAYQDSLSNSPNS